MNAKRSWPLALAVAAFATVVAVVASFPSAAQQHSGDAPPVAASKPTVVVNITSGSEDLHAACMGIGLATTALHSNRRAMLFLNVRGAALAAADLPTSTQFADFPPVKDMLQKFVAAGGELYVCGHCAAIAKLAPDRMMKGVTVVQHGDLFEKMPAAAVSFSY